MHAHPSSINREAAVNLVYYFFCNLGIQNLWQGREINVWPLQITHAQRERSRVVRGEGLRDGGDSHHGDDNNPGHVQMVFWFPQRTAQATETHTQTQREQCAVNLHHMFG